MQGQHHTLIPALELNSKPKESFNPHYEITREAGGEWSRWGSFMKQITSPVTDIFPESILVPLPDLLYILIASDRVVDCRPQPQWLNSVVQSSSSPLMLNASPGGTRRSSFGATSHEFYTVCNKARTKALGRPGVSASIDSVAASRKIAKFSSGMIQKRASAVITAHNIRCCASISPEFEQDLQDDHPRRVRNRALLLPPSRVFLNHGRKKIALKNNQHALILTLWETFICKLPFHRNSQWRSLVVGRGAVMAAAQPCRRRRPLLQVTCLKRSTRRSEGTASWAHSSAGAVLSRT